MDNNGWMKVGIDIGISTTKVVGIRNGEVVSPACVSNSHSIQEAKLDAFDKYLADNHLSLDDIESVALTGVGASYIKGDVYGLPTTRVGEFMADCRGASFISGLDSMIVVSMGTGTTIVRYDEGETSHLGGIGMGGGTLTGLSRLLLHTDDIPRLVSLAEKGDLRNIDVQIGDICEEEIPNLPSYATASLFGKAQADASPEDVALGLICTVVQTIGSAVVLSSLHTGIKDFVMIGNLSRLPQCKDVFSMMEQLYGVRFHIPSYSEYATVIGAAL